MCYLCDQIQKTGSLSSGDLALTTLALSLRAREMDLEDVGIIDQMSSSLHRLGLDGDPKGPSHEHKHFYAILISIASGRLTFAALRMLVEDDDLLTSTAQEAKMLIEKKSAETESGHR